MLTGRAQDTACSPYCACATSCWLHTSILQTGSHPGRGLETEAETDTETGTGTGTAHASWRALHAACACSQMLRLWPCLPPPPRCHARHIEIVPGKRHAVLHTCSTWSGMRGMACVVLRRASKAAVHVMTKALSIELADQGVSAVVVHPGYVKTDLTGKRTHAGRRIWPPATCARTPCPSDQGTLASLLPW